MARTLSQLSAGATVYLDETVSGVTKHVPYYYLGLDAGGNARLLRQYAAVKRRMHSANAASYDGCEADLWLEDSAAGFLSRFDAATLQALQNTSIQYVDYNQSGSGTAQVITIARRCFLLSYSEVGWSDDTAGSEGQSYVSALRTATGQANASAARIPYTEEGSAVSAFLRSAYSDTDFRVVNTRGNAGNLAASNTGCWLRPALSVAAATPVSDEGAEAIFLLPDGRRTCWAIEAAMSLGKTASRPKSCKLSLPHDSFTVLSVQVCNNYGDAEPTWIDCADGGVAAFGAAKTAADWELGVKLYAEAPAANRTIGEAAMIVEFDVTGGQG